MITFVENNSPDYSVRTKINALADITIAFVMDFNSYGEILTKKCVFESRRLYIPVNMQFMGNADAISIAEKINLSFGELRDSLTINIAGNGIYTLIKFGINQIKCDEIIFDFLNIIFENLKIKNIKLRCGGQTGADESGAKVGLKLGFDTVVISPNGWKFRDVNCNDICNEKEFKQRFI